MVFEQLEELEAIQWSFCKCEIKKASDLDRERSCNENVCQNLRLISVILQNWTGLLGHWETVWKLFRRKNEEDEEENIQDSQVGIVMEILTCVEVLFGVVTLWSIVQDIITSDWNVPKNVNMNTQQ